MSEVNVLRLAAQAVREPLDEATAETLMNAIVSGRLPDLQVAGVLGALEARGASGAELEGFARALSVRMVPLHAPAGAIDTAGTGGSGRATLNTSTLAGVVAAAGGAVVAKHGNRSASGNCGSLDVLEALGANVELSPSTSADLLGQYGFTFVNARRHHPGLGKLGPIRQALGFRTVFNLLGPILSPARVRRQLLGVSRREVAPALAEALRRMGHEVAWVVSGPDGLDELDLDGESTVWAVKAGTIERFVVRPKRLGLASAEPEALRGGDAQYNAARFLEILTGQDQGPARDHVLLNAGAALVIAGLEPDLPRGLDRARASIDDGRAARLFEGWTRATRAAEPAEEVRP